MPVHYSGVAPDMNALLDLCRRRSLRVVEDAAQALGARWRGRPLGTLGDAGCFSFHESKNITCGEGGALAIDDPDLARRAEVIREKGTNRSAFLRGEVDKYTWVAEGSSYVLSDVLAAILEAQLEKLPEIEARRAAVVARYRAGLAEWAGRAGVRLPPELPDRESNHHIFHLLYPDETSRDSALATLRERGVMASFHYIPLHSAPQGRAIGADDVSLPVTDRVASTLLRLPLHARLSDDDVDYVIEAVRRTGRR
jgi:dTDP-4-amino-4,6-dideoxygalactose transaminase